MRNTALAQWWAEVPALSQRLSVAWQQWAESRDGAALLAQWASEHAELSGWTIDDLASPRSGPATDGMQGTLLMLTQAGSAEAGLTLLVQMRPGLVRLARSAARWDWIRDCDVNDDVQATFFESLYRHDLSRRPTKIAANLLLDTRQRLWRRFPRSGPPTVSLNDNIEHRCVTSDRVDELGLWLHLRDGLHHLPGSEQSRQLTATLAYRAWISEEPSAAIANDLGLSPHTVSTRLYRLRQHLRAGW